jgi:hypothetical protein
MSGQTVDVGKFSAASGGNQQLANLVSTFNESPTMVSMVNQFTSSNLNQIVFGIPGKGTFTDSNSQGGLTITIDPSAIGNFDADQLTSYLAHEFGHATQPEGLYTDPAYVYDSPTDAAFNHDNAEGVASVASYNVANELTAYNSGNNINETVYANGNDLLLSQRITNQSTTTYTDPTTGLTVTYSSVEDAQIATAATYMGSQAPSVAPHLTYDQYAEDGYALSNDGSATGCSALNNQTVNWQAVTAQNFQVVTTSNSWSVNATGVTDKSGNIYDFNGTFNNGSNGSGSSPLSCQVDINPNSSAPSAYVDGTGQDVSINGGQVFLQPEAAATVNGNNNAVSSGTGSDTTLNGADNTVVSGSGSVTNVQGDDNLVDATGGTISDAAGDTGDIFNGDDTTINLGSNFSGSVEGTGNSINLTANSDSSLLLSGTDESVSSTGNTIDTEANAVATINGVTTIDMTGSKELLDLTSDGDTIDTTAGSVDNALTVTDATINGASGFSMLMNGTGDTVDLTANSGSGVELYGTGNTVNAVGDAVYLETAGIAETISGSGDTVGVNQTGDWLTAGFQRRHDRRGGQFDRRHLLGNGRNDRRRQWLLGIAVGHGQHDQPDGQQRIGRRVVQCGRHGQRGGRCGLFECHQHFRHGGWRERQGGHQRRQRYAEPGDGRRYG